MTKTFPCERCDTPVIIHDYFEGDELEEILRLRKHFDADELYELIKKNDEIVCQECHAKETDSEGGQVMKINSVKVYSGSVSRLGGEPEAEGTFIVRGSAESLESLATLMQSAPSLLEAAKAVLFARMPGLNFDLSRHPDMLALEAAIKKAEGKL